MRHLLSVAAIAGLTTCNFACTPQTASNADDSFLGLVLGAGSIASTRTGDGSTATDSSAAGLSEAAGRVAGNGVFRMIDLGPGHAGERWTLANSGPGFFSRFVVVLFDADYDLLIREVLSGSVVLEHLFRRDTDHVYLGVMSAASSPGGDFAYSVHRAQADVPSPAAQTVWLNFAAGQNVSVHGRSGISFAAFDGAMLGERYIGQTTAIKASIVQAMREDYAPYNVTIITSDERGPPEPPYSVLHFGGDDSGLLGLADNVDRYNRNPSQNAVVYIRTFANYSVMELEPAEMGQMVGNVASHELGHLLGLYHTRDPSDVMDSTGSAWELATNQRFGRTPLEPSVFLTGMENTRRMLEQTVGLNTAFVTLAEPAGKLELTSKALLRSFVHDEIRLGCGTCLALDD